MPANVTMKPGMPRRRPKSPGADQDTHDGVAATTPTLRGSDDENATDAPVTATTEPTERSIRQDDDEKHAPIAKDQDV